MKKSTVKKFQPNNKIKALLARGDKVGNFAIGGKTEAEFEQHFLHAFECAKAYAVDKKQGKIDENQNHLKRCSK